MCEQPLAALGETLRVGADDLDLRQVACPREQVLADFERQLPRDHGLGLDEAVERDIDRSFGRVLDRDHAVLGTSALDLLEDVRDGLQRNELCRHAEATHGGRMGEGPRGSQVADGQRILEGERGGENLAPDRAHRIRAERTAVQLEETAEQLGLTLRDEVRRVLLSLELADLEGGVSALVEEVEDLIVEVVDPGTPVVQVHKGS